MLSNVVVLEEPKVKRNAVKKLNLVNGTLVVVKDARTDTEVKGVFIVTSYRTTNKMSKGTSTYCSLVGLETGYIQFEEPCSRLTTEERLMHHLASEGRKRPFDYGDIVHTYRLGNYLNTVSTKEEDEYSYE